jgi:flagellar motility protein MotE (MotC chaperone)
MNVPRLLPLIGVAVAGVVAVNALAGAKDLPQMLSAARAMAEGVAPAKDAPGKGGKGKGAKSAEADTPPQSAALPPAAAAPAPVGICAPGLADLAKSANLSPAEMQTLMQLQARRGQIDLQAKDLDTQTQLLTAAELKLDAKLKVMQDLKAQIEALMGQTDQKTQAEVDRLTMVYAKMSPKQSAPLMAVLDDKVRIPLAAQLETAKPKLLAEILANMPVADAKHLTELLARRFAAAQQLADASKAPPPAAATPATPPKPGAKPAAPAKTASAEADPDDANVDEAPAKPAKKPVKIAKRAPPKKKPAAHAPAARKPVEEAKAPSGPRPYSEVKDAPAKPAPTPAATPAKVG